MCVQMPINSVPQFNSKNLNKMKESGNFLKFWCSSIISDAFAVAQYKFVLNLQCKSYRVVELKRDYFTVQRIYLKNSHV